MIGVFLTKRNIGEGGGKTITDEIFFSFIRKLSKNNKNFIFLISNDPDDFYIKELKKKKLKYKKIHENTNLKKILIFISNLSKTVNYILCKLNILKLDNFFKKQQCKLIWFLSSEYREPITTPYIATVWDLQFKTHPEFDEVGSIFKILYKNIVHINFIRNATKVITGTNIGKKQIIKFTGFKKNFIILPHPVSDIFLNTKKINKKNPDKRLVRKKYFLYPANFWKHKNHINLIKAFYQFQKKYPYFRLVFTGKKENNYKNVISLIKNLKLKNKIIIFKYLNFKKLITLYDNCFAVTYVSYSGPENLPPIETIARKKILINSIYDGVHEQLKDYPIYVKPNSVSDILSGMIRSIKISKNKKIKKKFKLKTSNNYIKNLENEFYK